MDFRVGGIVDENSISCLRELGISQFKFDLRPWSLAFTPLRIIRQCIENNLFDLDKIFICFEDDSDLTILESIKILSEQLSNKNFYLEFYRNKRDLIELNELGAQFYWHLMDDQKIQEFHRFKNLKGIIINYDSLLSRLDFNQSYQYLNEVRRFMKKDQSLHLYLDWDSNFDYQALELLNFKTLSLDINNKVEKSYREADFNLIETYLNNFKRGSRENTIN